MKTLAKTMAGALFAMVVVLMLAELVAGVDAVVTNRFPTP
jgi:hypothetical protein